MKIEPRKKDGKADPNCVMCNGYGEYEALNVGEYDETYQWFTCACTLKER